MDCSLPALIASHSQMVSLVSNGEGKGAGGNGIFQFFFFFAYIRFKFYVYIYIYNEDRNEYRKYWKKIMHNLDIWE